MRMVTVSYAQPLQMGIRVFKTLAKRAQHRHPTLFGATCWARLVIVLGDVG